MKRQEDQKMKRVKRRLEEFSEKLKKTAEDECDSLREKWDALKLFYQTQHMFLENNIEDVENMLAMLKKKIEVLNSQSTARIEAFEAELSKLGGGR